MTARLLFLTSIAIGFAAALAMRLPRLDQRPMHADEAVQAARSRGLWLEGRYAYDPDEFHGPTLNYATLPALWLSGARSFAETSEATYRLVPALFGAAAVLWLLLLADGLGRPAAACAAVLLAVSPAMVFYNRYYIHESLLVFFALGAIACFWRWLCSGRLAWCIAGGAAVGLMQATKETAVLSYAAAVGATAIVLLGRRLRPGDGDTQSDDVPRPLWHLAAAAAAAILVALTLYTSFFTNPPGAIDAVMTYLPWLQRAGGHSPHVHPWHFYLERLAWWRPGDGSWWSELLIVALAGAGLVVGVISVLKKHETGGERSEAQATLTLDPSPTTYSATTHRADGGRGEPWWQARHCGLSPLVLWLGAYTLLLTAIYTVISYKTPWCLLEFLVGMILLAGVGAVALVRLVPTRPLKILAGLLLVAAAGQLVWQSHRAAFRLPADPRNPYVYAHTLPDIVRLQRDVDEIAAAAESPSAVRVKVVWPDTYYWPLPWYLRSFNRVGYWTALPDDPSAPLVIAAPEFDEALTARLGETHLMTGYYGVRPGVLAMLWVREDLWLKHLKRLGRI